MITTLLLIFGAAFIVELSVFFYGLRKSEKTATVTDFEPKVSIIVAARNEEAKISNCLTSLSKIEYPIEKLEIIIVNDQSTDKTESLIKSVVEKDSRFKLVNAQPGTGHLIGKANALSQAIDVSKGEIILFTDADCDVPVSWVKSTVPYFTKEVGIVGGFTILKADSIFAGLQSLDWVFLYSVACATATIGFPLTAVGNNLAIRRTAYDTVGGYNQIPFSVTEDYMLTRKIIEKTGLKMVFPLDMKTLILSHACKTWSQLYHQRKRWGIGALDMVAYGFFIFGIPYALNLLLLTSIFFTPWNIFLIAVGLKFIFELLLESYSLKKIGSLRYIKYFLFFEFYYFIYVLALPWVAISSGKVKWKGRIL